MKNLILLGLAGVGVFAIWKHHQGAMVTSMIPANTIPNGVSIYPSQPAAQYPQQVFAAQATNPDAVSDVGYSAAFGPNENQPGDGETLY